MTEIPGKAPGKPPDFAGQLRANWVVLSNPAALKAAGIIVQPPTPAVLAGLPPVATGVVAAAAPAGTSPLQIAKYAQMVDGKVVAVVDDGSAVDDATLAHFAVTVVTGGALPASGVTYQIAARPHGAAPASPGTG